MHSIVRVTRQGFHTTQLCDLKKKNKDFYFSSVHKVKYESFLNDRTAGDWLNLTEYSVGIQKMWQKKPYLHQN